MGETTQEQLKALEKKIQALEDELQQVRQSAQGTKETFQEKKVTPVWAFWKNDFFLSTADENFWMKIRGNLHFDTKFYGGNSNNPTHFEGTGALELLVRYTRTETDEDLFIAGILEGADTVDEYTVGLSWTWNPMVRWQLNYVRLEGEGNQDDVIRTGSGSSKGYEWVDDEDMIGLRMIFKF